MGRVRNETGKATSEAQNLATAYDEVGKALQESINTNVLTILANETEITRLTAEIATKFNNPTAVAAITGRIAELKKQNEQLKSQTKAANITVKHRTENKEKLS